MIKTMLQNARKGNTSEDGLTGTTKQCVAFARRWLYENKGMVFDEVKIAANIWDSINFYTQISTGERAPLVNFVNGSPQPPKEGDLIIYGEQFLKTGHVAIVADVDVVLGEIIVYEQNYNNVYEHPHQKRLIRFINNEGRYWLLDDFIIGWKSLEKTS